MEELTLTDLCRSCGQTADWIIELVEQGILDPAGPDAAKWRFKSTSITIIRRTQRLQQDLGVNLPGVAVVLNLVEEKAQLQARLQRLESFALGEMEDGA